MRNFLTTTIGIPKDTSECVRVIRWQSQVSETTMETKENPMAGMYQAWTIWREHLIEFIPVVQGQSRWSLGLTMNVSCGYSEKQAAEHVMKYRLSRIRCDMDCIMKANNKILNLAEYVDPRIFNGKIRTKKSYCIIYVDSFIIEELI